MSSGFHLFETVSTHDLIVERLEGAQTSVVTYICQCPYVFDCAANVAILGFLGWRRPRWNYQGCKGHFSSSCNPLRVPCVRSIRSISINVLDSSQHCEAIRVQLSSKQHGALKKKNFYRLWNCLSLYFASHAMNVTLSHFPPVAFVKQNDLLVFASTMQFEKQHKTDKAFFCYLRTINKLFYFTVSYVFGRTSVKSVLTVLEPFKWLLPRESSGTVQNN